MSGKIFVHIGLPKTATSTLQTDFFPALTDDAVEYIGVDGLRREECNTRLYSKVLKAVNSGEGLNSLRAEIAAQIGSSKKLILSEEMFTVSEDHVPWRLKLSNLSAVLDGMDYELILTVREPSSALFSYYVELYPQFFARSVSFLDCAMNDKDMQIFHYGKLTQELFKRFERSRIHVFRFEDISQNDVTGLVQLISPGSNVSTRFKLNKHNSRKEINGFVMTRYSLTALGCMRQVQHWIGISNIKAFFPLNKLVRPVIAALDKIIIRRAKVPIPSQEDMTILQAALRNETAALEKYFGIIYE